VSDASGINPFINEINYGLDHGRAALDCAQAVVVEVAPEIGGPFLQVLTLTGEVTELDDRPTEFAVPGAPFFSEADGFEVNAPGRTVETTWEDLGEDKKTHRLTLSVSAPADGSRTLEAVFPLELEGFFLTPGLVETDAVFHPFSEFDFQEGRISLPVANGLVGIGEDLWLIKHTASVHIAATYLLDGKVRFIDDTLDPEGTVSWVFWILEGSEEDAVALADRLNLHPVAYIETGVQDERGCGCGAGAGPSTGLLLLLALALAWRRRAS
jgi:MYXO-CTERM domain-containing protein